MDLVTDALVKECLKSQQIENSDPSVRFEHFVNFVVVSDLYGEDFDVEAIATGAGEFGIDGICIIVNDTIVEDVDQFDDLAERAAILTAKFIFIQSKTSPAFDTGDVSKFFLAVRDFFSATMSFKQNERINQAFNLKNAIYAQAAKFTRGLPDVSMHYATTGQWQEDRNLCAARDLHKAQIKELHIFNRIIFEPLDATKIQKLYFQTKNAFKVSVSFQNNIALPSIDGVREAYIGVLALSEFMKMISDEHGEIRRKLFFDNIRDFQGETAVNEAIAKTISSSRRLEFPLLNNGTTIVTRKLMRIGNDFQFEDFQIVNGCQTSHVISRNWSDECAGMMLPIKVIATEDEEITRSVIIASNSQNRVDQDTFWALDPIHKQIEIFFDTKDDERKLYYERRPGQYNVSFAGEKIRIVTKEGLLKAFASMFLEEPNQVGRYYKDLLPRIGKDIFAKNHAIAPYYTAAYAAFRLEWLFINKRIDTKYKPFRYQLVMALRLIIEIDKELKNAKKMQAQYCSVIDDVMLDVEKSQAVFERAIEAVDSALIKIRGQVDSRTAKMRDMKDALKIQIADVK